MRSQAWERRRASRSSVQRDFPEVVARVAREVVLLTSPREVERGMVSVGIWERGVGGWLWGFGVGGVRVWGEVERRVVKRETWARARAEERVEMRRVGFGGVEGFVGFEVGGCVEVWKRGLGGSGGLFMLVEGGAAIVFGEGEEGGDLCGWWMVVGIM